VNTDAMLDDLLVSGPDDWVMACEVAWVARSKGGARSSDAIRELSVELIRELLDRGLMTIGDVTESGFHAWELSTAEALDHVDAEWRMLSREPSLGDICWLQLTEKGEARAEAVTRDKQVQD